MRFLFGLTIGIAITIGGAYLHDINLPAPATVTDTTATAPSPGPIVNWDTLQAFVRTQTNFVRDTWHKLVG